MVKICIHERDHTTLEEKAYDAMRGLETTNTGAHYVRHILDDFDVQGPSGYWYHCFILAPTACSVSKLMRSTDPMPIEAIKVIMYNVLRAIDFLHIDVQLVHTDIKASNVLVQLKGSEVLHSFAQSLRKNPLKPVKRRTVGRKIYRSQQMPDYGKASQESPDPGRSGRGTVLAFGQSLHTRNSGRTGAGRTGDIAGNELGARGRHLDGGLLVL